jgi:hypothetical protein
MIDDYSKVFGLLNPRKNTSFFHGSPPGASSQSFDDGSGVNLEKKTKQSNFTNFSNYTPISLRKIDRYRQGVEMTELKHYVLGLELGHSKPHSGEPGHRAPKLNYGYGERTFRNEAFFEEIDKFDTIRYMNDPDVYVKTYVSSDHADLDSYNFNGVIEPLTIRSVAAFFSIDVPFEAHSVWANLESGNSSITRSYDRVVTVYEKKFDPIKPWLDMIDMIGVIYKMPTPGYFNNEQNLLLPFNDLRPIVELSATASDDMNYAILDEYGNTDNYIPDGHISATCGWSYDDVTIKGTDSVAFGGLGY